MRHVFAITALTLGLVGSAMAEHTLFNGRVTHGGYGGPAAKFTEFAGEFGVLAGGEGGWIMNHSFMIGGGGYGLATDHHPQGVPAGYPFSAAQTRSQFGYGGVILSYIGYSDLLCHPIIDVLVGGGAVNGNRDTRDWIEDQTAETGACSDRFFVVEPRVSAELNIVSFMRLSLGAGYRLVSGVNKWGYSDSDISGASASATLKFGKF